MCMKLATIELVYIFLKCSTDWNVEQSAIGSDVITNVVIIQIPTENLAVPLIISWPLI